MSTIDGFQKPFQVSYESHAESRNSKFCEEESEDGFDLDMSVGEMQQENPLVEPEIEQESDDDGFSISSIKDDTNTSGSNQFSFLLKGRILHQPSPSFENAFFQKPKPQVKNQTGVFCEPSPVTRPMSRPMTGVEGSDGTPRGRQNAPRNSCSKSLFQRSFSLQPHASFNCSSMDTSEDSPVVKKKWCGDRGSENQHPSSINPNALNISSQLDDKNSLAKKFIRCHSESEAMIKSAVMRMHSEPDLIADSSKPYCLPTIKGKHADLKSISPETLTQVLNNEFSHVVENYHIIDSRYPYEYEGGHIRSAVNIYQKEEIIETYLKSPIQVSDPNKRLILIFHCEFSSERGPSLYRFLRKLDRNTNKEFYPFLHYPEIYVLEGGYKAFYHKFPHHCEPQNYVLMVDVNHADDMRRYRAKCKSWTEDPTKTVRGSSRSLKF